ncbi:MAG: sigma-54 dependent transcriptional regulator [Pseudomonadota bacterium]
MSGKKGHMPLSPILIVDDEIHATKSFELNLRSNGFNNIISCSEGSKVYEILETTEIELILLDLVMPDASGEDILAGVVGRYPEIPVIMVTGINAVDTAVRCMQKGAFDYVLKPVEKERLLPSVSRAVEVRRLRRENARLTRHFFSDSLEQPEKFSKIITQNHKMRAIFQYCEAIAGGSHPVLITGETGAGKELIAEALHAVSGRSGDFVAVNIAGLDDSVFSDTLFGHIKGAFTDASAVRSGQIEKAAGGTLFLDEIGDISLSSQVKLLRLLDKNEYFPLGSDVAKLAEVRFLFATHKDLSALVQTGRFREDLFYRLRTHRIDIPPLWERMDDIPILLDFFIDAAAGEFKKERPGYRQELIEFLQRYPFPGNVREFKAMVFDAVGRNKSNELSTGSFKNAVQENRESSNSDFPALSALSKSSLAKLPKLLTIKEMTTTLIREALHRTNHNQREAALMLGITPQALNQRLKKKPCLSG